MVALNNPRRYGTIKSLPRPGHTGTIKDNDGTLVAYHTINFPVQIQQLSISPNRNKLVFKKIEYEMKRGIIDVKKIEMDTPGGDY